MQLYLIALTPRTADAQESFARHAVHSLSVDLHVGITRPLRYTQIQRESYLSLLAQSAYGHQYIFAEWILCLLVNDYLLPLTHQQSCLAIGIGKQGRPTVGTCQHQILCIIRPTHGMIMLATATAEGIHGEEGAAVVHPRMMVAAVGLHHVGTGEIAQGLHILGHSGRQTVEGHIFQIGYPHHIARLCHEDLIGKHLLHKSACLCSLTRVDVSMSAILI